MCTETCAIQTPPQVTIVLNEDATSVSSVVALHENLYIYMQYSKAPLKNRILALATLAY